jgi:hypothetical protein
MKHGKKPTVAQRNLMQKWKLDPAVWLVTKDTSAEIHLVHRFSDRTTRIIHKEEKRWTLN